MLSFPRTGFQQSFAFLINVLSAHSCVDPISTNGVIDLISATGLGQADRFLVALPDSFVFLTDSGWTEFDEGSVVCETCWAANEDAMPS